MSVCVRGILTVDAGVRGGVRRRGALTQFLLPPPHPGPLGLLVHTRSKYCSCKARAPRRQTRTSSRASPAPQPAHDPFINHNFIHDHGGSAVFRRTRFSAVFVCNVITTPLLRMAPRARRLRKSSNVANLTQVARKRYEARDALDNGCRAVTRHHRRWGSL
ncbi:hypothetical protein EVAR_56157_1 [Eumeta japonica]|uniref:Uncharacterized protein n=1 Tax=Eumeta variegata TaxID=151549 RepID=A0A4C1Y4Q9_EUMVA|nr:hypothetical protein EVAR_56157_1 [Eumeta japonica]